MQLTPAPLVSDRGWLGLGTKRFLTSFDFQKMFLC
jgi:hypothetical protein